MAHPSTKDRIDDKFLGILGLVERTVKLIERGYYRKAKECLGLIGKCSENGRKLAQSLKGESE